jgi:hypothetical protein
MAVRSAETRCPETFLPSATAAAASEIRWKDSLFHYRPQAPPGLISVLGHFNAPT